MLKISEFSQITQISARMLRHYDKMAVLQPAFVDRATGYRYYLPEQIDLANKVTSLKRIGIPLKGF